VYFYTPADDNVNVNNNNDVTYSDQVSKNQNQNWFNKDATYVHQHNNSYTE